MVPSHARIQMIKLNSFSPSPSLFNSQHCAQMKMPPFAYQTTLEWWAFSPLPPSPPPIDEACPPLSPKSTNSHSLSFTGSLASLLIHKVKFSAISLTGQNIFYFIWAHFFTLLNCGKKSPRKEFLIKCRIRGFPFWERARRLQLNHFLWFARKAPKFNFYSNYFGVFDFGLVSFNSILGTKFFSWLKQLLWHDYFNRIDRKFLRQTPFSFLIQHRIKLEQMRKSVARIQTNFNGYVCLCPLYLYLSISICYFVHYTLLLVSLLQLDLMSTWRLMV